MFKLLKKETKQLTLCRIILKDPRSRLAPEAPIFFFLIFQFFTHSYIHLLGSDASRMSYNKLYGSKKFIYTL